MKYLTTNVQWQNKESNREMTITPEMWLFEETGFYLKWRVLTFKFNWGSSEETLTHQVWLSHISVLKSYDTAIKKRKVL